MTEIGQPACPGQTAKKRRNWRGSDREYKPTGQTNSPSLGYIDESNLHLPSSSSCTAADPVWTAAAVGSPAAVIAAAVSPFSSNLCRSFSLSNSDTYIQRIKIDRIHEEPGYADQKFYQSTFEVEFQEIFSQWILL